MPELEGHKARERCGDSISGLEQKVRLTSNVIVVIPRVLARFLRTQPDAFIRTVFVHHALAYCVEIKVVDFVHESVYLVVEESSISFCASDTPLKLILRGVNMQAVGFRGDLSKVPKVWTESDDSGTH